MAGPAEFILGIDKRRTRIDTMVVDVTEMITTTLSSTITKWPVERSNSISDNILLDAIGVTITGFISNAPTGDLEGLVQSVAQGALAGFTSKIAANSKIGGNSLIGTGLGVGVGSAVGGALGQYLRGSTKDETYPQKAMKALIKSRQDRKPFTIRTFFFPQESNTNIYTNMVITNLTFNQNAATGDGLAFTMTAEQIEIVNLELQTVSGEFIRGFGPANSGPQKKNLGAQGTSTPTTQTQAKTSGLKSIVGAIKGGF